MISVNLGWRIYPPPQSYTRIHWGDVGLLLLLKADEKLRQYILWFFFYFPIIIPNIAVYEANGLHLYVHRYSNVQESSMLIIVLIYRRYDGFYRGSVVPVTMIVHNITAVFAQWEADEPSDVEVGPAPDLAPPVKVRTQQNKIGLLYI